MATSEVSICNLALQKLGATRITSFDDDTTEARECSLAYEPMRDRELRAHRWSFAIARDSLAEDTDAPDFGPASQFTLPSDFLRLLPKDPEEDYESREWRIEGRKILTSDSAPLEIRYVRRVTDPNEFDALFIDALACRIAFQLCEKITQSNQKKAGISEEYKTAIREAKQANGIEVPSTLPPDDDWIVTRL